MRNKNKNYFGMNWGVTFVFFVIFGLYNLCYIKLILIFVMLYLNIIILKIILNFN